VTRGRGEGRGQTPNIFVGDVAPMNIRTYIRRFHVTDGYIIIYFLVSRNINYYICRRYIPQIFHRLIEEFNINSSVL
jgi:Ni,Fe-hydrogenase I cytochrome b subunit